MINFISKYFHYKIFAALEMSILLIGVILGLGNYTFISKIIFCLFWTFSVIGTIIIIINKDTQQLRQLFVIFLLIGIFYDLYGFNVWKSIDFGPVSRIMLFSLLCINLNLFLTIFGAKFNLRNIINFILENKYILCFILIFIVLNWNIIYSGFTPDAYSYYSSAKSLLGTWDFSLSKLESLQMAGHLTLGYTIFADIGLFLFGNIGIKLMHLLMSSVTIFCFYKIIAFCFFSKKQWFKMATTLVFAFSPFFMGIMHGINSDFPLLCFFVWFVYADCYNKNTLKLFFSFLLCFSKENGVIVLIMYLFGDFVFQLIKTKRSKLKNFLLYITSGRWIYGSGVIFFCIMLLFGGSGWGENAKNSLGAISGNNIENKILFNLDFILYKVKEVFVLNFSWLIVLFLVVVFITLIYRKVKYNSILNININRLTFSLFFSFVGFFSFNLLFFTYPHYRYLQLMAFYFALIIAWLVDVFSIKKKVQIGLLIAFSICFFVQSFYTFDPVSLLFFPTINIGEREIVTTKKYISKDNHLLTAQEDTDVYSQVFFDSTLNNKDQLGFENVTEKALSTINYNGNQNIIFPTLYGNSLNYTLLAMFGRSDLNSFYWDKHTHNITDNETDLKILFLDINEILKNMSQYDNEQFYYLQYPYSYEYDEEFYLDHFTILETTEINYKGWIVNILLLKLK